VLRSEAVFPTANAMSATGLDVFDRTLHKTYAWLNDLMVVLPAPDKHSAYVALRATLHALRDRMTVEEVAQLGAQLPMLIRGFYYEGWDPTGKPLPLRHKEDFLVCIAREWTGDNLDPEDIARAVFVVLTARITKGEIEHVKHVLPAAIRDLWP
jgi:uncharacterized protein (DUF2267 family)